MRHFVLLALLASASGCGGGDEPASSTPGEDGAVVDSSPAADAAVDAPAKDSSSDATSTSDTFVVADTGVAADSSAIDSFVTDSSAIDSFVADVSTDTGPLTGGWNTLPAVPTGFAGRRSHGAVWSGSRMIVWGGADAGEKSIYGDGASYDPATSTWKTLASAGIAPRYLHATAWSGSEMLVIGGITAVTSFGYTATKDGALYDPAADAWSAPITLPGSVRYSATAVWSTTTNEFLVWGGFSTSANLGDGYAYKPSTKTWRTMSAVGAPSPRNAHAAAWNGTKMVLIGGSVGGSYAADAFAYDPVADTWESLTPPSGYRGRNGTTPGFANGDKVAFWGGRGSFTTSDLLGDGLLFTGTTVTAIAEPSAAILPNPKREQAVGWWSGGRVYVWGGRASVGWIAVDSGASYDSTAKTWSAMPSAKAPSARYSPTAVVDPATGNAYVWGGYNGTVTYGDGAVFKP